VELLIRVRPGSISWCEVREEKETLDQEKQEQEQERNIKSLITIGLI